MTTTRANEVTYEGPVYRPKVIRESDPKVAVARMRTSRQRQDGEWTSVFFDVKAFDDAADVLASCQDKDEVLVQGYLSVAEGFTTRNGEEVPPSLCVVANKARKVGTFEPPPPTPDYSDVPF